LGTWGFWAAHWTPTACRCFHMPSCCYAVRIVFWSLIVCREVPQSIVFLSYQTPKPRIYVAPSPRQHVQSGRVATFHKEGLLSVKSFATSCGTIFIGSRGLELPLDNAPSHKRCAPRAFAADVPHTGAWCRKTTFD
jgi:hypothetical protein